MTRDGLVNNIEFAALISAPAPAPLGLLNWSKAVEAASEPLSSSLLNSYRKDREKFEKKRAAVDVGTFTWTKKQETTTQQILQPTKKGDLIVEVMPQETRGGNQVQLPKLGVQKFFGISEVGSTTKIRLRRLGDKITRALVITVFQNKTVRISLNELEYGDRPCLIHFQKLRSGIIQFEIISESLFPSRYRRLLAECGKPTRSGSRRWFIA